METPSSTRQRRRYTQVPSRISGRWSFLRDQLALFEAWFLKRLDDINQ